MSLESDEAVELVQRKPAEVDLGDADDALPRGLIRQHVAQRLLSLVARSVELDDLAEIVEAVVG